MALTPIAGRALAGTGRRSYHTPLGADRLGPAGHRLPGAPTTRRPQLFTLAHCSDWHATEVAPATPAALAGKRALGWLSWNLRRRRTHRPEVLEALLADLVDARPDHVAVTGDLTNVALGHEFVRAARWLAELGDPSWVSLVPGNHDAYVAIDPARGWDLWAPYLWWNDEPGTGAAPGRDVAAPTRDDYPRLRRRGPVALVGLCTALPTPVGLATGRLGAGQIERLDALLTDLGDQDVCRVILLHHPPTDHHVSARRRLSDFRALERVVAERGAELVLHGHVHRRRLDSMPGPHGPVPVVSVPSSSDVGHVPAKRAAYHLYDVERDGAAGRWRIRVRVRGYDPASGGFADEGEQWLGGR